MIACFLSNISAKYYKNPSMLCRVIAKNVGDVFFETQCSLFYYGTTQMAKYLRPQISTIIRQRRSMELAAIFVGKLIGVYMMKIQFKQAVQYLDKNSTGL